MEASMAAGYPFKGRDGVMIYPNPKKLSFLDKVIDHINTDIDEGEDRLVCGVSGHQDRPLPRRRAGGT